MSINLRTIQRPFALHDHSAIPLKGPPKSEACHASVEARYQMLSLHWCNPLTSPSLQFASVVSDHRSINNGGPNQGLPVKITQ